MCSPHTFVGKVVTLLVGLGLSWLTVMHPPFQRMAAVCLEQTVLPGEPKSLSRQSRQVGPDPIRPLPTVSEGLDKLEFVHEAPRREGDFERVAPDDRSAGNLAAKTKAQIATISSHLRRLGATYLLLERLTDTTGECYRVRCDLAGEQAEVKCCLEAVRGSALDAMMDVLRAVQQLESTASDGAKPVGPSL